MKKSASTAASTDWCESGCLTAFTTPLLNRVGDLSPMSLLNFHDFFNGHLNELIANGDIPYTKNTYPTRRLDTSMGLPVSWDNGSVDKML